MKKILCCMFACLLALAAVPCWAEEAPAKSPLTEVWDSGVSLLFDTDNVTLDGEASFDLDGEWFKTAQLHYVQDGTASYFGLYLLSPRKDGTTKESGWIIIGQPDEDMDYGHVYVMETLKPGQYRQGTTDLHASLLRRSVELDALAGLGGSLAAHLAPALPEGAVTAEEDGGVKTVRVTLAGDQIPAAAQSALNLAAGFLADRWMNGGYERSLSYVDGVDFDDYVAPASALAYGTVRWTLKSVDVYFSLDAEGRLIAVNGSAAAESTFWDDSVRTVEARFSLIAEDFGASSVAPFAPEDYGVALAR